MSFQSTRPLRGGTFADIRAAGTNIISIHPPLAGRDDTCRPLHNSRRISIHPPLAGRDSRRNLRCRRMGISIHPPLAGRDVAADLRRCRVGISIHPPLAGRDQRGRRGGGAQGNFNPPAPCGAGRALCVPTFCGNHFNPPAPCGAGPGRFVCRAASTHFNPPAPCGAGPLTMGRAFAIMDFNPPAPCGAGQPGPEQYTFKMLFQSTRPLRGGTPIADGENGWTTISIHPPLAGRDVETMKAINIEYISIHPPLAGRDPSWSVWGLTARISIHPPLAGRDDPQEVRHNRLRISIHPPLAGRDSDLAQKNCAKHRILHKKCIYPGRIERFSGFDAAIFSAKRAQISVRTFRRIAARSPFARLYHQDPLRLIAGIDAEVFHLGFIAIAQIIKPQAVLLLVHQGTELMLKLPALRSIQYALEHGILDALPIVHALLCNQAEPPPSCRILCVHIIRDQNQHRLTSRETADRHPDRAENRANPPP